MPGAKSVFVSALTEVTSVAKDQLGDIRWVGNKVYKYVKMANITATVAVVAGDPVAYLEDAGYGAHSVVSDMNDAAAKPVCAGIVGASCAAVHGGTVYYLWVQIKGPVTLVQATITASDGDTMQLGTTDKTLIVGAAADDPVCIYMTDVTAKLAALDCPF